MTVSSFKVFMSFVDELGDSSMILSKECYLKWVSTRKGALKQPEESFRRVLTAHICGLIGRKPFPPDVEANLLKHLRRREIWDCFKGTKVSIGIKGFRKLGFHESRRGIFGKSEPTPCLVSLGKRNSSEIYDSHSYIEPTPAKKAALPDYSFGLHSQLDLSWLNPPSSKYSNHNVYGSYNISGPLKVPTTPKTAAGYSHSLAENPKTTSVAQAQANVLSWPSFV